MASRPRTRSRNRPVHTGAPSPRLLRLAREAGWLLSAGGAAYIGLVLFTYHAGDPGWSHNGEALSVANAGGHFGAWLADLLLYLFGFSAYWFAVAALMTIWWGYCLIDHAKSADRHSVLAAVTGFGLLLAAGSGFAALYARAWGASLPAGAGGVVGDLVAPLAAAALGVTGAGLAFALIAAVGLSFFIGLSWLHVLELLGTGVEWLGGTAVAAARRWKTRFARRDRAAAPLLLPEEPVHETDAYADSYLADEPAFDAGGEAPTAVKTRRKREPARRPEPLPAEDFPPPPPAEDLPWEPLAIITPPPPRLVQQVSGIREVGDAADLLPPLDLLDSAKDAPASVSPDTIEYTSRLIERKLAEFGVQVKVLAAYPGPVITRYEVEPATGVKGSQVVNLMKDLSRALSLVSIRVVETIPGKSCMGLELPNPKRQVVRLSEIINSAPYVDMDSSLTIAMGKDISGQPVVANLAKMPHVLVAGTTGSGKSVAINAMILSLIYKSTPKDVRLILIDPKMLELSVYEGIPHLLAPVVTDMKQAAHALNWCVGEMERRYKVMSLLGVRNLAGFNQKIQDARERGETLKNPLSLTPDAPEPLEAMPVIVVVIDELADLMMVVGKKIEELIARLAQKARAAGVHLVLATQRPSVDVITGLIKANVPTRVAFQVSSKIDSRTILDQMGAETLLGQGDMLYLPPGSGYTQRIHGAYVSDQEVHRVVDYLKEHGEPQYVEAILTGADAGESGAGEGAESGGPEADGESDALYDQAVAVVLKNRRASISLVQRHLRVGYNRAARLLEQMERSGLVSAMQSNGNREVLAPVSNEA